MRTRKPEKLLTRRLAELVSARTPEERVAAVRDIGAAAEELERSVVAEAREAGLTWGQIGSAFGMTKQAAQQRFKPKRRDAPPGTG